MPEIMLETKSKINIKTVMITVYSIIGIAAVAAGLVYSSGFFEEEKIFSSSKITSFNIEKASQGSGNGGLVTEEEVYECVGTVECGTWAPTSDFSRNGNEVCIGYQTTICPWEGGDMTLAVPLYLPGASEPSDYLILSEDLYQGYVPYLPQCTLLTFEVTYNVSEGTQGDFTLDWISTINHGTVNPPFSGYCGWPLSEPPEPFVVHL